MYISPNVGCEIRGDLSPDFANGRFETGWPGGFEESKQRVF